MSLSSVDNSIRTRLLSLQTSFFQSLQNGTDAALTAFHHEMIVFNETLSHCVEDLQEETYILIYSFVKTSNAVIPALIDLDVTSEKINQVQSEEFSKLLGELSLDDAPFAEPETYPPYLQPAYAWLLDNLHDPYPSKQTRITISKQTNTPQKDIDSWFTDVRKRIGWNSLRKHQFSTRKEMIAAATRFFKPSSIQLDPRIELEHTARFDQEFALLEDSAKNLYSKRFSTTNLAKRLDAMKDLMPETNPAVQGTSLARDASSRETELIPQSPYPSSASLSPSPPTLPTFSSPSSTASPSPQPSLQSKKRRQSTSDPNASDEGPPFKRTRTGVFADPTPRFPSPQAQRSPRQHSQSPLNPFLPSVPTNSISISKGSRKRKRQSSDSEDDQGRVKRAHYTPPSPSNYLVDPLPASSSNSDDLKYWLESLGGESLDLSHSIPEPVCETSPLSAPVEIDLYRYASSSPSTSVSSLGPSTPPGYNSLDSPTISYQSLSWLESPPLTKAQGYDSLADVTSELLSTNWSTESFFFDLNSPGTLDAEFSSQNWDLGLTPTMSANNYSISQVLQESVDNSTQPWTSSEPAVSISIPRQLNQLSPPASSSDMGGGTSHPQVSQHPALDKKGAKMRYLQTLLNEVQNVRFELAI